MVFDITLTSYESSQKNLKNLSENLLNATSFTQYHTLTWPNGSGLWAHTTILEYFLISYIKPNESLLDYADLKSISHIGPMAKSSLKEGH